MPEIRTIQFKRGAKAALTSYFSDSEHLLLDGEPAFEKDTGQLKIGNGIQNYAELPYVGGTGGGGGEDPRFIIHDPVANQVLLYDAATSKWVNKDLADAESIIYLTERGLTLKGYDAAQVGQMLVKSNTNGLAWQTPVSIDQVEFYTAQAERAASNASLSELRAGQHSVNAQTSARDAENINRQTINYVENKFWWGTLAEYNALDHIDADIFYYIIPEV